jgi:hypothetical protein
MDWKRPQLILDQVLALYDSHHAHTGQWSGKQSGKVWEGRAETWSNLDQALRLGLRGLPRGLTRARLLQEARGVRNRNKPPPVTKKQIVAWAVAQRDRTGVWPTNRAGPVQGVPSFLPTRPSLPSRKRPRTPYHDSARPALVTSA